MGAFFDEERRDCKTASRTYWERDVRWYTRVVVAKAAQAGYSLARVLVTNR